jgi:hypothetical protein
MLGVSYMLKQWVFLCDTYVESGCVRNVRRRFCYKFPHRKTTSSIKWIKTKYCYWTKEKTAQSARFYWKIGLNQGLSISLENPFESLHRRLGFKVSGFRFALFLKRNLNGRVWIFYGGNAFITVGPFPPSSVLWVGCIYHLWSVNLLITLQVKTHTQFLPLDWPNAWQQAFT